MIITRYFHTTRHLSGKQVLFRIRFYALRKWWAFRKQAPPLGRCERVGSFSPLYEALGDASDERGLKKEHEERLRRAVCISEGKFCFLNQEKQYERSVDWHDPSVSQLYRYHLHYFDYVEDLLLWAGAGVNCAAWEAFCKLVSSWISNNNRLQGDGWHPYTVSLRIVNWVNALGYWQKEFRGNQGFSKSFLASLFGQARYLATNLEHDVRGNHLLKNLKGLLWAGKVFEGEEARSWCELALTILRRELAEQVLADGGHFERAPGYHGVVLADCVEIGLWLRRNGSSAPQWLDEAVSRMLDFLKSILPFDHQLPLLKDTVWGEGRAPVALLCAGALYLRRTDMRPAGTYALYPWLLFGRQGRVQFSQFRLSEGSSGLTPLSESGFFVLRDEGRRDHLVFDCGEPCPDYLPAHAHADMFSYELMVGGQRVVVDSGVYEYAAGKWRDYFRSTRAHNTVEIEGKNQSEVWGSFRVARRARPGPVHYTESKKRTVIDAWHDGYQKLGIPVLHRRVLWWEKGLFWFVLDEVYGKGRIRAKSFVHLHPSLTFEPTGHRAFQIHRRSELVLGMRSFGNDTQQIVTGREEGEIQGWYSEKFGEKTPNSVLCLGKESKSPFCFGYVIYRGEDIAVECSQTGHRMYGFRVILQDKTICIDIEPGKVTIRS